ncbi:MAG: trigger factor [Gemmatimonadaceae bacterium]|nr:trigger factor [Gloeobacterales cyanobacterium ES-bin-141]
MKVTQQKLPHSQLGLEIEVEADRSKQAYEKLVRDYSKSARIPGFRPGKAPRHMVIQFFGRERIRAATLDEVLDTSLKAAIEQESIQALGNFQIRDTEALLGRFQPGEPFSFSASVDIQPEVALHQYQGLTVRYKEVASDPNQVDETFEKYRQERADLVPVEGRPSAPADVAFIDFSGFRADDSTEIPGAKDQNFKLELVPGRFIPGFVEGIIGMEIDEERTLQLQFPEDYPQSELAGVAARFEVALKDLKQRELPELDDNFAQDISEYQTLQELREHLAQQNRERAEEQTANNRETALIEALIAHATVDLPETLVRREVQFLAEQSASNLQQQGIDPNQIFTKDNIPRILESLRGEAETRLKRTLCLAQVAKLENIIVSEEQVATRVQELLTQVKDVTAEAMTEYAREELLTQQILEWLTEHSTVEVMDPEAEDPSDDVQGLPEPEEMEPMEPKALAPEDPETVTPEDPKSDDMQSLPEPEETEPTAEPSSLEPRPTDEPE